MWLLGRVLPLMVGDKVPSGDEFWINFFGLTGDCGYLNGPRVH